MTVSAGTLDPLSGLVGSGSDFAAVTLLAADLSADAPSVLADVTVVVGSGLAFGEAAPNSGYGGGSFQISAVDDGADTLSVESFNVGASGLGETEATLYVVGYSQDGLLLSDISPQALASTIQAGGLSAVDADLGVFAVAAIAPGGTEDFTLSGSYSDAPVLFTPDPTQATVDGAYGSANAVIGLQFDTVALAASAQPELTALSEAMQSGGVVDVYFTGAPLPPLAAGETGFLETEAVGAVTLASGYDDVVDLGSGPVLAAAPGDHLIISSGDSGLTYAAASGADTVYGGDGPALIFGAGASLLAYDEGATTLIGGAGGNTVNGGAGAQLIFGDSSLDYAGGQGAATIIGGGIGNTIAGGAGDILAFASAGLTYSGGTGQATVIGGGGPLNVDLGAGGGLVYGSPTGHDTIDAGSFLAILVGGGDGDRLTASGAANDTLVAGGGAETLDGSGSTGNLVLFGGPGPDLLEGGAGANLFIAESGNETLRAGGPSDSFVLIATPGTTRTDLVQGFDPNTDAVGLFGYSAEPGADAAALASATVVGSDTEVSLSDGTTLVFAGAPTLNSYNFF